MCTDLFKEAKWEQSQNQGLEFNYCNCYKSAIGTISTTSSEKIAKEFLIQRNSDGQLYRGDNPENAFTHKVKFSYDRAQHPPEGVIFRAEEMEDKFDLYHYDSKIYISRSWTGELVIVVGLKFHDTGFELTTINDKLQKSSEYSLKYVDFVIKSHCFNIINVHPLPEEMKQSEPEEIAKFSFAEFGRRGWYATFDDTLKFFGRKKYPFG